MDITKQNGKGGQHFVPQQDVIQTLTVQGAKQCTSRGSDFTPALLDGGEAVQENAELDLNK